MKTVKFFTLGCKANQYDTQSIRERFFRAGFREAAAGRAPAYCVVNTCTVTAAADRKSRSIIRQSIRTHPASRILVTGCLVEKDAHTLAAIKGVDLIIGKRFFPDGIRDFSGHTRAFLKVQDGCGNACSYCKVPLVRGSSRSRSPEEVIAEAERLVAAGFKEIVLTGICLGAYGRDLNPPGAGLADLVRRMEAVPGLERIRLSSIEARDVTSPLIDLLASSGRLCRHLHIPLQSGDDGVLRAMQRPYTAAGFLALARRLRRRIPDLAVTTDVMIGFPVETEAAFRNTVALVKKIRPLRVHIFPYSPRPGTVAARHFPAAIPPQLVTERFSRLAAAARASSRAYCARFLGTRQPVLFEGRHPGSPDLWEGHTGTYVKVLLKSQRDLRNVIASVRLKEITASGCVLAVRR